MKKLVLGSIIIASTALTGCATSIPVGGLMTDVTLPISATSSIGKSSKVGTSHCQSILGMLAQGDCSIEAAKRDGGISKVYHVDWKANNILGIIGKYETTVYGD
ncbi:MAG: TRL-like protein family [Proteobacteria bacterium]|nr:MAG: TRL-like protein family [Pseudomonadota bacterium]PIE39943.1 MAG: TRL-like protein family [Gammaproteobacteria bacterium]